MASRQQAQVLARREAAVQQLAQFRHLSDEARFYAASTDATGEHAPYYDPRRAIMAGELALAVAAPWGREGERLPLPGERDALVRERTSLLLAMANAEQQDHSVNAAERSGRLLEQVPITHHSLAYHRLRSQCALRLGFAEEAEREATLANDKQRLMTAEDYFFLGESHRVRSSATNNLFVTGNERSRQESLAQAITAYQKAIELDPRHYWALFQLSRSYLGLNRKNDSLHTLSACVALRPDVPWAYATRGLLHGLADQFDEAHVDLTKALSLDPTFRPARLHRGFVYWRQGKQDAALADFETLLALPSDQRLIEAAWYRAHIRMAAEQWNDALADCAAVIDEWPAFRPAYELKAQVCLRAQDHDAAIGALNELLRLTSGADYDLQAAIACKLRGRALRLLAYELLEPARSRVLVRARSELQTAIERGEQDDALRLEVERLPEVLGLDGESIESLTRAIQESPGNTKLLRQRAWTCVNYGQYEDAAADFRTLMELIPDSAECHAGLSYVLAAKGQRAAAEQEAALALFLCGPNYVALHNVACTYATLAQSDQLHAAEDESRALALLNQAVKRFGGPAVKLLRAEPAFSDVFRARPEFQKLAAGVGSQSSDGP
jgi:tetratricopeptide (TPR) repeat protein